MIEALASETGTELGPYELSGPSGEGGMGEVRCGRDPRLGRDVAPKVLPGSLATDASALSRFRTEALVAAPAEGIVHRDLEPENVLATDTGLAKLLDFGIAKVSPLSASPLDDTLPVSAPSDALLGAVGYMSPKQAAGRRSIPGPTGPASGRFSSRHSRGSGSGGARRRPRPSLRS